jgi:hypothetical protein
MSMSYASREGKENQARTHFCATKGTMEFESPVGPGKFEHWGLRLDQSNLSGKELEMVELTLPAGEAVGSHHHGSAEIF